MTIKDPVCGMEVSYPDVLLRVEFQGQEYFFCSDVCRDRFVEAPDRYVHQPDPGQAMTHPSEEPLWKE